MRYDLERSAGDLPISTGCPIVRLRLASAHAFFFETSACSSEDSFIAMGCWTIRPGKVQLAGVV